MRFNPTILAKESKEFWKSQKDTVTDIILFGSAARGKPKPDDIDILLLFREKIDKDVEYAINAQDEQTLEYLNDVNIEYQCVQFLCEIGKTSPELSPGSNIEKYQSVPNLKAKFPFCYNGIITAKKEGYLDSAAVADSNIITIKMTPLANLEYNFIIQDGLRARYELEEDESLLIMLSNEAKEYDIQAIMPSEENKIALLSGDYVYDANIILTKNDMIIGGFRNEQLSLNINKDHQKITFYIFADSMLQTEEASAAFWQNTVELRLKEISPVLTW